MIVLSFLSAFVVLVSSQEFVYSKATECSIRGPKFWCRDEETAKHCQATSYCQEHEWTKKTVTKPLQPKADYCLTCEQYVGTVHLLISNNSTKAEMISALKSACTLLPSAYASECTALMTIYAPQIVNWLSDYTAKPQQFCSLIGLCNSSMINRQKFLNLLEQLGTDYCLTCEQYVGTAHLLISNNETKAELVSALKLACTLLPSAYASECSALMALYAPQLVNWLSDYTAKPSQFCTMIGLCKISSKSNNHFLQHKLSSSNVVKFSMEKPAVEKSVKQPADAICDLCVSIVEGFRENLMNNFTRDMVKDTAEDYCSFLPPAFFSRCMAYVDTHEPIAYEKFIKELDPNSTCEYISLCPAPPPHLSSPLPKYGPICVLCEAAISEIVMFLKDNSTKMQLKNALKEVCNSLPSNISSQCDAYVENYFLFIVDLIMSQLQNSLAVCTDLKLCIAKVPVKQNDLVCTVCTDAMTYLDSMLRENSTEEDFVKALDSLCVSLPPSLKTECQSLVGSYGVTIYKLLVSELADPAGICKKLGLCTSSVLGHFAKQVVPKKEVKKVAKLNNIVECDVCEYAMGYLDSMLADNHTEEAVKSALDKLCGYLPSSMSGECTQLVNAYSDSIIKLIVQELAQPATLCKDLGLCTSKVAIVSSSKPKKTSVGNPITCEVCELAMGYLDKMLDGNKTEQAVTAALDKLCSYLPSSVSGECVSLVNTYATQIVHLIVEELANPATLCKELQLCSSALKVGNPITCEVCELAMGYLDKMLDGNKTEQAVTAALDKLCGYLPSSVSGECTTLVNTYADQIVKLIIQELASPATICKELGLCSANMKQSWHKERVAGAVTCELCMYAMGELDSMLKEKATETEIKQALDSLCVKLPSHLVDECKSLVESYEDTIITMLAQELDPSTICKAIGVCTSEMKHQGSRKFMLAMRLSTNGVSCGICQYAMGYLDSLLTKKSTEAEIEAAVEKLCSYLPSAIKNECDALIMEYGDELIKLLVQQVQPTAVCKALKLC